MLAAAVLRPEQAFDLRAHAAYRDLAQKISADFTGRKETPTTVTFSTDAELPMRYYLRTMPRIFCPSGCAEKLKGVRDAVWIWHTPPVPEEIMRNASVKADISRGRRLLTWDVPGLHAVWIRYPETK